MNKNSNVQVQDFVNQNFIDLVSAHQFRRSRARIGAVSYGTAVGVGNPIGNKVLTEMSFYAQYLVQRVVDEARSDELLLRYNELEITVDALKDALKTQELDEERKTDLLISLDKSLVEMEILLGQMEALARG